VKTDRKSRATVAVSVAEDGPLELVPESEGTEKERLSLVDSFEAMGPEKLATEGPVRTVLK